VSEEIKQYDERIAQLDERTRDFLLTVPNLPHPSVPVGQGEQDNVEVRRWGAAAKFSVTPRPRWEVGRRARILDRPAAVTIADALPIKVCAWTACFRSEAGAAGKDTRGIARQHQFQKVELFKFTRPESSYDELELLVRDAEAILQRLGLHHRVIQLCTADLGF